MTEHLPAAAQATHLAEPWFRHLVQQVPADQQLYMIIDAAHDERIFTALHTTANVHCCLFNEDRIAPEIEAVAPHLVKLRHLDEFTTFCLSQGVRSNWLLLFSSTADHVMQLRLHFKHFSLVADAEGKEFLFRYYDPRVLPSFISACTTAERDKLFQAVEQFYIPSVQPDHSIALAQWSRQGPPQQLAPPTPAEPTALQGSWAAGFAPQLLQPTV